ncbi:MAG: DEAD/DEAH box helicase [Planctomycetes bacterium]|nr:DEAD/DEAH box helicase [Planctomycetota bacterium]
MNSSPNNSVSRDDLALKFLETLPYAPYPVQEEAILAWFETDAGVMVCAPTGTGKTLIAEAAIYEALQTGKTIYYTTPLIALTEQKFRELQETAQRWGFAREQIGLVTGNRRVNPQATVLVVVAEILLNRLLNTHWAAHVESQAEMAALEAVEVAEQQARSAVQATPDVSPASNDGDLIGWYEEPAAAPETPATVAPEASNTAASSPSAALDFDHVSAIVMDEFHCFSDPERGIVWEFSLALMPRHIRLLLLSATIGNAPTFVIWCARTHGRRLELIQSSDRRVALQFQWVPDKLLTEHLEEMAAGDEDVRRTPALVFCFNREQCWNVAEELKGKSMLADGQQKRLVTELDKLDWSKGVGPKLRQLLMRGVGVHHAGILPKYKRIVEELFQKKLLTICVCTETLAAGINLPARSVVLPSLLKGKPGEQKIIDPSSAHQIFGRAGRPQFDKEGFVFAIAHEDDVRILRWRQQYDQIPEDTKDPLLIRAKKALKKKMPTRSPERQYWNDQQFEKLRFAQPGDLVSRGPLPWRLLAYMLQISPEVDRLRTLVHKRLMDPKQLEASEKQLERMLVTLHAGDFIRLHPEPPPPPEVVRPGEAVVSKEEVPKVSWLSRQLQAHVDKKTEERTGKRQEKPDVDKDKHRYRPILAHPTDRLQQLFAFRSLNPIYGMFLVQQFGAADRIERMLLLESVLELPRSLIRNVRVPPPHKLPPGPLALERVDPELIQRGLIAAGDLYPEFDPDIPFEERKYAPSLADKVRMLFDAEYPEVNDVMVQPVMVATDLLENWGDNFWNFISGRELAKQEGLIFRHLLRMVLMLGEFRQITPPGMDPNAWQEEVREICERLTACCRTVDPTSTDLMLAQEDEDDFIEHGIKR